MPWKEVSLMSQRIEFVMLASKEGSNISELCRRYEISRKTAYKWINRYSLEGEQGLENRSRRPLNAPTRTPDDMVKRVLKVRKKHKNWGGRKLKTRLEKLGLNPPAASTITEILRKNKLLDPVESEKHTPWRRFEREEPNELWQMDFKGDFGLDRGGRCHPLTVLDDHSRYAVCLRACSDQRGDTVKRALIDSFRHYGMPESMLMDNGSCWGSHNDAGYFTAFTLWLIRHGITVIHGRIYHPQTQGKNERFNRTLKAEVIGGRHFRDIPHCQREFDSWRPVYNMERPHEGIGMLTPMERLKQSPRQFPEQLPSFEYSHEDAVRKVYTNATLCYKGHIFKLGKAFIGQHVAIRPTCDDGVYNVYYCHQRVAQYDLRNNDTEAAGAASSPPPGGRG